MNYFEFYNIPVSFKPDQNLIKKKFYAFSKEYHPDFYVNDSEEKQKEILELSTLNNKAYQILSNPEKLIGYVLELTGELTEGEKYELPSDFLMDMMELNETLMELEFDENKLKLQELTEKVEIIDKQLKKEKESLIPHYDLVENQEKQDVLRKIKDLYYRQKYLLRIKESIHTFASRL